MFPLSLYNLFLLVFLPHLSAALVVQFISRWEKIKPFGELQRRELARWTRYKPTAEFFQQEIFMLAFLLKDPEQKSTKAILE